jgi:hypothetical protein
MGFGTYVNFGVPTAGVTQPDRGGILQPKYKYRFRVFAFGFGNNDGGGNGLPTDFTQQVMTVGRPNLNQAPVAVHSYNSISYYAGKHEWQEISLKVRDDITNSVSILVSGQVQKQLNHYLQTGQASGSDYKFNMLIQTLDGSDALGGASDTGQGVLENWYIEGCFLSSVNWGEFDYAAGTEFMVITMNVRYDNATQGGGSLGTDLSFGEGLDIPNATFETALTGI